jgi:hypothetical protein
VRDAPHRRRVGKQVQVRTADGPVAMQLQAVARSLPRAAMGCRLPAHECVRCSGSAHMEQVSSRETRAASNTPRIADG